MISTPPGPVEHGPPDPDRWKILAVLLTSVVMTLVGVSIVNVALPSIQLGLAASQAQIQWILSGYALTFGVLLVPAGRAGDLYGRGHLFILGVAVFAIASLAAGCAPNAQVLIAARVVQGIGSGLLNPQAIGMIQDHFRGHERARAYGMYGSSVGISLATGPLIGGLLIQAAGVQNGWRWTFLVNIPIAVITCALAVKWLPRVPRTPRRIPTSASPRDLDPVGALLLVLAIVAILLPFIEAGIGASPLIWSLLPIGLGLMLLWGCWERSYAAHGGKAMVDLSLFKTPSFANGMLLITLYFLGVTSVWVLVALYMQDGLGHSALASGAVGMPNAVLSAVAATWGGRQVLRFGRRVVVIGMATVLLGLFSTIAVIHLHGTHGVSEWWMLATLGLVGAGQGAVISPNQTLTLADVPLGQAGSAGGVLQTGQRVAMSIGIAMITALTFGVLKHSDWTSAATAGLLAITAVVMVALAVALGDLRRRA